MGSHRSPFTTRLGHQKIKRAAVRVLSFGAGRSAVLPAGKTASWGRGNSIATAIELSVTTKQKTAIVLKRSRRSTDRIAPSEGADVGSIPTEST